MSSDAGSGSGAVPASLAVDALVPARGPVALDEVLAPVAAAANAAPFSDELVAFSHALSRALFSDPRARRHPELVPLASFLRRAAVTGLADEFAALNAGDVTLVPRGLAFHVPPSSIDTMFVYSLMVSVLAGNRNVVRLSQRRTATTGVLLDALDATLTDFPRIAEGLAVVSYGHDLEPSAALSRAADVRVIWGGDGTIETIRALPLAPHATELLFGDRFSFAAVRAGAEPDPKALFADAYWFDQRGCSSPRLVVGVGDGAWDTLHALFDGLEATIARRGYALEPGAAMAKRVAAYGALADRPVRAYRERGNALTVVELDTLAGFDRTHPGAGLFYAAVVDRLTDLAPFVARKDQTLTVAGFEAGEIAALVAAVNGRGIDRVVPFGDALRFGRFWDGYDLLAELTRRVHTA